MRAPHGQYRITFDTSEYMARCREAHPGFFAPKPFYPSGGWVGREGGGGGWRGVGGGGGRGAGGGGCVRATSDPLPLPPPTPPPTRPVSVEFEILPSQAGEHFHVPLTWNPYGYSTYRGS